MDEVEGVADVEIEEFLAVLAEENSRVCIVWLILVDHDEIFDARDGCPSVKVEDVGLYGFVPFRCLVFILLYSR